MVAETVCVVVFMAAMIGMGSTVVTMATWLRGSSFEWLALGADVSAYTVYGDGLSGNCYKVQLLCGLLDIEFDWVSVDILAGGTRTAAFLALNPNGMIPLLVIDGRECLAESNAILNYLADGSDWLPGERLARARVLQWQCFEQYSHEPYIAVARYINKYLGLPDERRQEYQDRQIGGRRALAVMEQQLQRSAFIAGDSASIADISLYAYTQVAHEGGFDLDPYPALRAWLGRIAALPGYRPMRADVALAGRVMAGKAS